MLPVLEKSVYDVVLFVGTIATLAGVYSLFLGIRHDRRVSETVGRRKSMFQPHVCLIMPCKGIEPQLEENIDSLLRLDYPNFHVLIVTDTETDPAHQTAGWSMRKANASNARLITSNPSRTASGKVTALLTALENDRDQADPYAFVDSDATITSSWLSELVDPLERRQGSVGTWHRGSGLMFSQRGTRLVQTSCLMTITIFLGEARWRFAPKRWTESA